MRSGLNTIQQTLTPEAASVLNHSIAEAGRRNHGQTTPLHVAATLLASPSGYLRQACIRSHPNSSHPLQCRALELCFSVALDRLPSAQNLSPAMEPPISNALMAALKRAQAHQRRGCPEQQQQPLLAIKVELEQLIISILDDPSVSRVMREASFSSPTVKASIEQSLNSTNSSMNPSITGTALAFRPNQPISLNRYLNPRLSHQPGSGDPSGDQRREEVKKVIDILLKSKKRNPVLVGESEPGIVVRELLQRIEKREVNEEALIGVQVVSLEKEFGSIRTQVLPKMKELGDLVEDRINSSSIAGSSGGVILDLGDLKWLVEHQKHVDIGLAGSDPVVPQTASEAGCAIVSEMGKLLARFKDGDGKCRLWLIGTATCDTYLRCQVYHQTMENGWDLQVLPIAARSPMARLFPRIGSNGIVGSSTGSVAPPLKGAGPLTRRCPLENVEEKRGAAALCSVCRGNYEQEMAKLDEDKFKKSSQTLPLWMQAAMLNNGGPELLDQQEKNDDDQPWKQKSEELMKKWNETCCHLHPSFHLTNAQQRPSAPTLSVMSECMPNLLQRQWPQHKIQLMQCPPTLPTNRNSFSLALENESHIVVPDNTVETELVLGCPQSHVECVNITSEDHIKAHSNFFPSMLSGEIFSQGNEKIASILDADFFKRLIKGLTEKVTWQKDAAAVVATSIVEAKFGEGKRRSGGAKGDTWLLFVGPDSIGKKKMALALSELVCLGRPITIQLGSRMDDGHPEPEVIFRGKTVLDRIAEAVRRNPFSIIVLEGMNKADMLVHTGIKQAMQKGRLRDSHGREISLGNVIFILTIDWLPESLESASDALVLKEHKLAESARHNWQLHISVIEKMSKRRAEWEHGNCNRATKQRKNINFSLSLDLNLAVGVAEDDVTENSSDVTVEHGHDLSQSNGHGLTNICLLPVSMNSSPDELIEWADNVIVFKPVDFSRLQTKVMDTIKERFTSVFSDEWSIEMDDEAVEKIVGGAWFGKTCFEQWLDDVLVPGFHQLKRVLREDENAIVRLVTASDDITKLLEEGNGVVVDGL